VFRSSICWSVLPYIGMRRRRKPLSIE